jgi:hypothetical protein
VLELKILEHSSISSKRDWRIQVDNPFESFQKKKPKIQKIWGLKV